MKRLSDVLKVYGSYRDTYYRSDGVYPRCAGRFDALYSFFAATSRSYEPDGGAILLNGGALLLREGALLLGGGVRQEELVESHRWPT